MCTRRGEKDKRRVAAVGSEDDMAQVIEFYVPVKFQKKGKWVPRDERGKVLEFPLTVKKTA
jgi:hypothetical protein